MATLVVLLVPLALLHAVYGQIVRNDGLNVVVTDAINDIIREYNNHYKNAPPSVLNDVSIAEWKVNTSSGYNAATLHNITASEGRLHSKGIKLAAQEANVTLFKSGTKVNDIHLLSAKFPITLKDLKIQYDRLHVRYSEDGVPFRPPGIHQKTPMPTPKIQKSPGVPTPAVKAVLGKNQFNVEVLAVHVYKKSSEGNTYIGCAITISSFVQEALEANITISGMRDTFLQAELDELANKFQSQLTKKTGVSDVIETKIKERAPAVFRNCAYYPPEQFKTYVSSFKTSLP